VPEPVLARHEVSPSSIRKDDDQKFLQSAITYDAVFNCLLDPIAKGGLKCKSSVEGSVREFEDMGTHQHRSLDSGHWGILRTVGGFD